MSDSKDSEKKAPLIQIGTVEVSDDALGIGKAAEAIPEEVYKDLVKTTTTTFGMLVSPLVETTSGIGRYIRQKFDNMVEQEKIMATFALQKAIARAAKARPTVEAKVTPQNVKTFVKALEEASKEPNPNLHEMWANLLSSQLTETLPHAHFVNILSQLGPAEAQLLRSLLDFRDAGPVDQLMILGVNDQRPWTLRYGGSPNPWNPSCQLLRNFGLADAAVPSIKLESPDEYKGNCVIFLSELGSIFMSAVSPREGSFGT